MNRWIKLVNGFCFLMLIALNVMAAPQSMVLTYEVKRNGSLIANVTETFTQDGKHYNIKSETKGIGLYALLGKRVLISHGEITKQGLKPLHFESLQSKKASKAIISDFDWEQKVANMSVKGEQKQALLPEGMQDLLSVMYQFIFVAPKVGQLKVPLSTGKRIEIKDYQIENAETLTTTAGVFKAIRIKDADNTSEDGKTIFVAQDKLNIPIKMVLRENGAKIEQIITKLKIE